MRFRCLALLITFAVMITVSSAQDRPGKDGPGEFRPRKLMSPRRAITDAAFLQANEVGEQVTANELVLGMVVEGKARAYPINMLTGPSREIINDTLGRHSIAATW